MGKYLTPLNGENVLGVWPIRINKWSPTLSTFMVITGLTQLECTSIIPSHSPKEQKGGGGKSLGALAKVVLTLHFRFLNYQSDPPERLSRDRSQELPWLQIMHKAIVSSSFCQLCLSMLSERAECSFLPRMPKSQSPRSRPRYEA